LNPYSKQWEQTYNTQNKTQNSSTATRTDSKNDYELTDKMLIWEDHNPTILDISTSFLKRVLPIGIGLLYLLTITFLTKNLILAILGMVLFEVVFIIIFRDQFFRLHHQVRYDVPNPFPEHQFWQLIHDRSVLYMTHTKYEYTTGIKVFQIKILPENVRANLERFLSSLAAIYIPFSYQVVQKPLRSSVSKNSKGTRFQTLVYFTVFYDVKGKLTPPKLDLLNEKLSSYAIALENNFLANFHHYNIQPLNGNELANSFLTFILGRALPSKGEEEDLDIFEDKEGLSTTKFFTRISFRDILKWIWATGVVFSIDALLNALTISFGYRIMIILGLSILLLLSWTPSLRSLFHKQVSDLPFSTDVVAINLFSGVSFFKLPRISDTVFYQTEDGYIGGMKQLHLRFASVPIIPTVYIGHHMPPTTKLYESLIQQHIHFTYTIQALPISYKGLLYFSKYLRKSVWNYMQRHLKISTVQSNWLAQRRGIWRTILTLSTSHSIYDPSGSIESIEQIEATLHQNITALQNGFRAHFPNCHLISLRARMLEMGVLFELLKTNRIRPKGTHLYHLLLQGCNVIAFLWLSDLFKKGIETKVATEFNSPLSLENFIMIGWTINTETLKREISAGFTKAQLDNLLITNGKQEQQHLLIMHIVGELIKKRYPSIIFDFTGDYSRLIRIFEGTDFEDSFLYYKLGTTFNLDLVRSGIKNDPNNLDYMDYMYDAYAACFKKDERTIEIFKNTLQRNLDLENKLSSTTVSLDLVSKPDWIKKQEPGITSVINFFKEFSRQELSFFQTVNNSSSSVIEHLLISDRTIIVDISSPNKLEKKVFLMFIMLAKLIHYIQNGYKFSPKFITLPHVDLVFDSFSIDKNKSYGRIAKFFDPLRSSGFGLIIGASQVNFLHSSLFTHFENVVSFKVVDKRDIAVLKNVMGLDTLHGSGIYSKSRNETYQIQYLMNLRKNEALIKRDDIYQPFPIEMDWELLNQTKPYAWNEIVAYMKQQGFDLESAVKTLIAQTKLTLFEKNFGEYSFLIEPIISFLSDLRTMDQIGNLFAETIKKELKVRLDPKLSQFSQEKKRKQKIRNEIFNIILKHEYLKEHHPPSASGSESVRTSYYVGPQFDKALEDFITVKKQIPTEMDIIQQESATPIEKIEKILGTSAESEQIKEISNKTISYLDKYRFQKVVAKVNSEMFMELFEIDRALNRKDYRSGLERAKEYLERFIFGVYNGYYKVDYVITNQDLTQFITDMTNLQGFPYTFEQFEDLKSIFEGISFQEYNLEETLKTAYEKLQNFYNKMQSYIYSDSDSEEELESK